LAHWFVGLLFVFVRSLVGSLAVCLLVVGLLDCILYLFSAAQPMSKVPVLSALSPLSRVVMLHLQCNQCQHACVSIVCLFCIVVCLVVCLLILPTILVACLRFGLAFLHEFVGRMSGCHRSVTLSVKVSIHPTMLSQMVLARGLPQCR
jgi:hypothetical protein